MNNYRETIQDNIKLLRVGAVAAALGIVIVPELIVLISAQTLFRLVTGSDTAAGFYPQMSPTFTLIVMAVPFFPLLALAVLTYTRMVMNAALYALMLNVDQNLEKLTGRG